MSYQEFLNKWNNKSLDFDGYYGYQCMDLWQQYNKDVIGGARIAAPYAKDVWEKNLYPKDKYTKISNTPDGIPQKGDVVIWSGAANGGAGHIAVFYQGDVWKFTSFDQNWNGTYCHFQSHNYNYVLGWLRPKTNTSQPPQPPQPPQLLTDAQKWQKTKDIVNGPGSGDEKLDRIRKLF